MKKITITSILSFWMGFVLAQSEQDQKIIGLGVQVYPAGLITTAHLLWQWNKLHAVLIRAGWNFADRKDFSPVNDKEQGNGPGGTIGYKRFFPRTKGAFFAGLHAEVWQLRIKWEDDLETPWPRAGITDITVFQPWMDIGYQRPISGTDSSWFGSLGFGREVNVRTKGDPVAQGWMGSLSIGILFAL